MITVIGQLDTACGFAMFEGIAGIIARYLDTEEYSGADEFYIEPAEGYDDDHVKKALFEAGIPYYVDRITFSS